MPFDLAPSAPIANRILTMICKDLGHAANLKHGGRRAIYTMLAGNNYLAHIRASDKLEKVTIRSVVIEQGQPLDECMQFHTSLLYSDPDMFQSARAAIFEILKAPAGKFAV